MKKITDHLNLLYLLALIPSVLFGLYKNGLELYIKDYVTLIEALRPLILIFMSLGGVLFATLIKEIKRHKKISLKYLETLKKSLIEGTIVACLLPIKSSPIIVFFVVFIVYLIISDNKKLNRLALSYLIIYFINHFLNLNIFQNIYALSNNPNYDGLDLFLGLGSGGICSTSAVLVLIGFMILCSSKIYKKDIVLSSIITYSILIIAYKMISGDYANIFMTLFSYNTFFIFVFASSILESTPCTIKGEVLSGIITALIAFAFTFFMPYIGALVGILFTSIIKGILDRIFIVQ